jgi:small subunit ribosomal protein S20
VSTPTIKSRVAEENWEVILANTKSAKKRIRQNEKRRNRNREIMSRTRTYIKIAGATIESGDFEASEQAVQRAISEIDRAAQKGVIHKNNAARRKSRLVARLSKMEKAPAS